MTLAKYLSACLVLCHKLNISDIMIILNKQFFSSQDIPSKGFLYKIPKTSILRTFEYLKSFNDDSQLSVHYESLFYFSIKLKIISSNNYVNSLLILLFSVKKMALKLSMILEKRIKAPGPVTSRYPKTFISD